MDKSGNKHGVRLDEEMSRESEPLTRGADPPHTRPWDYPEPIDTDSGRDPTATLNDRGGSPPGITPRDVQERSTFASLLAGVRYPATPGALAEHAREAGGPDYVVDRLSHLPDRSYGALPEVVRGLGIGHEDRRV
ncbi:DUF2795 domain-containing protein [Actinocorallia sp. A-T 12471]|uniref:DUF2795 domain-containing protein n=1 Tax=Actinocorallia sp. A-T 12471 TaxID=3089813 RepID=UPI0029CEEED2|nr:DUF2795 domain-containing protein [Actinocorallia sp. A-T 12471]MDX6743977.1 DUF2795 domain-containing protein [Actinocorallia sp. A-T 12471]